MARPWKHNEDRQERSLLFAEQGAATQKRGLSLCLYFPFVSDPQRSHFCLCAVAKQMTQQLFLTRFIVTVATWVAKVFFEDSRAFC